MVGGIVWSGTVRDLEAAGAHPNTSYASGTHELTHTATHTNTHHKKAMQIPHYTVDKC